MNDATAEFVRAYPDKLIGYLSVHPDDPGCLDEIERGVQDLGLRGIKLGPNYQNFDPLGEEAFRVYARAQERGLPITFHTGTSPIQLADLDYAHPRHFDRVAIAFPELKMVLAHMAHPWQETTIAVIRKHPNVYADISALFYRPWSFYNCMRLAQEWGVLHKLLFGTDYGVSTPQENIDALREHAVRYLGEGTAVFGAVSPAGLLAYLDGLRSAGLDSQAAVADENSLVVSTWHSAKGLEWPIVVVHGIEKRRRAEPFGVGRILFDLDLPAGKRRPIHATAQPSALFPHPLQP